MAKKKYESWKKGCWEAWRAFLPAFLAIVYAEFQAGVNLKEWKAWLAPLVVSAIVAGVKGVIKWARDKYGSGDYGKLIYKVPA